jgi:hypothetical protein
MRRIHNNCGKYNVLLKFERDMKFNSFSSFSDSSSFFFCLYSNIDIFTIYTQSFLWAIYVVLLRVR